MEEWGKELCCKFELLANLTIPGAGTALAGGI